MRKVMAAIRRMLAAMALPVIALVNGVWTVIRAMGPQTSTALEDEADEALECGPVHRPRDREAFEAERAAEATSEHVRVRSAAQALLRRETVTTEMLDPGLGRDARVLEWLRGLDVMELATVVQLSPSRLAQHLDGRPGAPLPPVRKSSPAVDQVVAENEPSVSLRRAA